MLVVRPSEPFLTEDVAAVAEEMVQVIFFKKAIFFRSNAKGINQKGLKDVANVYHVRHIDTIGN